MLCPRCNAEFRPGFLRCSDCDVPLVDHLSPEPIPFEEFGDPGYVVVAETQGVLEEGQIRSFLEANGIPVESRADGFLKFHGIHMSGNVGLKILVPRELAAEARDLLAKADRGELEIDAPDEEA